MLRGIHRYVAENHELHGEAGQTFNAEGPVLRILGDSLPEPLDFVSDKLLSVSDISETLVFGDVQDIQNGSNS